MSSSLDVLPRDPAYPSVEAVRSAFAEAFNEALRKRGATVPVAVEAVRFELGRSWLPAAGENWDDRGGLWMVLLVDGVVVDAIDACWFEDDEDRQRTHEVIEEWRDRLDASTQEAIRKAGHTAYVERQTGASSLATLGYGIFAGVIARLTNGVITSVDGAAPEDWFPTDADEFLARWIEVEATPSLWAATWDAELIVFRNRNYLPGFAASVGLDQIDAYVDLRDAGVRQALEALGDDEREAFRAAAQVVVDAHRDGVALCSWAAPKEEDGVLVSMGYPRYDGRAWDLLEPVARLAPATGAEAAALTLRDLWVKDVNDLRRKPLWHVVLLTRGVMRAERFNEGLLAEFIEGRFLLAVAERVLEVARA